MDAQWGFVTSDNRVVPSLTVAPAAGEETVPSDGEAEPAAAAEGSGLVDMCNRPISLHSIVVIRKGGSITLAIVDGFEIGNRTARVFPLHLNERKGIYTKAGARRWISTFDMVVITLPPGSVLSI